MKTVAVKVLPVVAFINQSLLPTRKRHVLLSIHHEQTDEMKVLPPWVMTEYGQKVKSLRHTFEYIYWATGKEAC